MGKGRRFTTSPSERFLGISHQNGDRYVEGEIAVELELMEEDVWSLVEPGEPTKETAWTTRSIEASGGEQGRRKAGVSDLSVTVDGRRRHVATSAPVKVPDWSKILKVESVESMHNNDADVVGSDWGSEMVPPHEYVAARSRNGGSSVILGVGRTLKGRDMRRVRDAVWSQTGFYG